MKIGLRSLTFAAVIFSSLASAAPDEAANPDPWEPLNRKIYVFNDYADRYALKPLAKGYQAVTPQFVEDGIHNVYANLGEVSTFLNSLLQAKFKNSAETGGRFLVNTTVGLVGFFDVASKMGLEQHNEDFGQTLGYWGVHAGPYLMVPLLGPRTLRDGFGSVADSYSDPLPYAVDHVPTRNQLLAVRVIDTRAQLLRAEELISGDRYIFLRDAYLQRRQFLINDGAVSDTFGSDDFEYDDDMPASDSTSSEQKPSE